MKRLLIALVVLLLSSAAVQAAEISVGAFTSQDPGVRAIGDRIPTATVSVALEKGQYSRTDVVGTLSYALEDVNDGSYIGGSGSVEKRYTIGNPDSGLSPYVGGGAGFFYWNGAGDSGTNFGTSLIGGVKLGTVAFAEAKYTDVRKTDAADGFTVTIGARF